LARPTLYTPELFKEYQDKGYWQSATFSDLWDRNAREIPDKEAVVDSTTRLTWSQANLWITRLALKFADLGLKKDDMVAVQLPNSVDLPLVRIACERAGLLCTPIQRNFRHKEMEYILRYVEAKAVVIPCEFRGFNYFDMVQQIKTNLPALKHIILTGDQTRDGTLSFDAIVHDPIETTYPADYLKSRSTPAEEYSLVMPTSGTTGFPKLVEQPICSRHYMARVYLGVFGVTGSDRIAVLSPAPSGPNAVAYFGAPQAGAAIIMQERFEAGEALRLIEKEKITFLSIVPTQIYMLVDHPDFGKYDHSSVRLVWTGAAPLNFDLASQAEEKFGCPIVQSYGLIDAGGVAISSRGDPREVRLRTVGKPMPGNEVRLDDGEIVVRGPVFVSGYYKDPETTSRLWSKEGWYTTGDLGRFDERGNLMIVGRKKDTIKRGGQNIYPIEVENLLLTHPSVTGAAVVGMPDPVMGERACAYVSVKKGERFTFDEMIAFLKENNLAPFKLPERLEIAGELPQTGEHKIDKKALQQDIIAKLKAEGKG